MIGLLTSPGSKWFSAIHRFTAWDEPNHADQPTRNSRTAVDRRSCQPMSAASPIARMVGALAALLALTGGVPSVSAAVGDRPTGDDVRVKGCREGVELARTRFGYVARMKQRLYACPRAGRGSVLLAGDRLAGVTWSHAVMAGRKVAISRQVASNGPTSHQIMVFDIRGGRACIDETAGTAGVLDPNTGLGGFGSRVRSLAVTSSGAVAYIAGPGSGPFQRDQHPDVAPWSGYEVIVRDGAGLRQVAAGEQVDPSSLRRRADTVMWINAGEEAQAHLGVGTARCRG